MPPKNARTARTGYRCADCGHEVAKWVGRCPSCQAWGTIDETAAVRPALAKVTAGAPATPARPIAEVDLDSARAVSTGIAELDRVLGGGIVPGAVVLLAGEPGVGKSTLLLEVAHRWAAGASPGPSLYVTGEESAGQVRLRAERTDSVHPELFLGAESNLSAVLGHVDAVKPGLLIVDSVQTVQSLEADGSPGGVTQVRAVTTALVALAKERGLPVVLVGHVTKDGAVAGPRVLEHLVDVVLHFEGDRHSALRMLRGVKNRFGPADEVGCFEQRDDGIAEVPDPSGLFINRQETQVDGTAVTVMVEGKRPLLVEVQSLVMKTQMAMPRRSVSGLDSARVSMMLAVLSKHGGVHTGDHDVFAATVGGTKVQEPAADLAIALAIASSRRSRPLPSNLIVVGEVGLAGEIRRVSGVGRRLAEAARLGFDRALVPPDAGPLPKGVRATVVSNVSEALEIVEKGK
ncbi:DNA repair protein RadA [Saccharopolyspora phatthalungensis]|uniref:DNA repair protein RadA n=1 Tax=Saccharopolyspora phatthalungensis TaxID=664693 RepID=A0A840QAQ9_9PSEU|nr:DNA repair protein RadA [Saccharopolyspora phatthalungensis]MBB5153933.1 DNA repair protein RadA/Sms [Saccharopolyspora phatthalungensis]